MEKEIKSNSPLARESQIGIPGFSKYGVFGTRVKF
jgi:hypothetical protein